MNSTIAPAQSVRFDARVAGVRSRIAREGWGGVLVLDVVDVSYLTGLESSNAALVITPSQSVVVTDFRYADEAVALGLEVRRVDQSLYHELGAVAGELVGAGAMAYSPGALSHRSFLQLTEGLPEGVTLRAAEGVVAELRRVKDAGEIQAIRAAAELLEDAYRSVVVEGGLRGRQEQEVAWAIERHLREHGASGMSFEAIVAGGTNGAFPHHTPKADVIPNDTLVTIDIGCVVDGYCSDCTRTFAVGDPSEELRRIYEVTLQAQLASLEAIRPGAIGQDVDAVARDLIAAAGYGDRFGHGLGHGVGRQIHETPRLSRTSNDVLAAGNIVTVEPGIYLADIGGVRIEDLVVVTEGGYELLTHFTKELITVG